MMIGSGCLNSVEAEPKANLKWHSGFYLAQNAAQSMNELQTKQFTALALSCWYNSYLKSHLANWMDPINNLL